MNIEVNMKQIDKSEVIKSGAVGISRVEKRQTTKMIGFTLSTSVKKKPEETKEIQVKMTKTNKKQVKKPLSEISKNGPKPKAQLNTKESKIELTSDKDTQSKVKIPKVLSEKSLSLMSSVQLKTKILDLQETIKQHEIEIQKLKKENKLLKRNYLKEPQEKKEEKLVDQSVILSDESGQEEEFFELESSEEEKENVNE
jgi:hypothetical protein